jgi:hypothetical protein
MSDAAATTPAVAAEVPQEDDVKETEEELVAMLKAKQDRCNEINKGGRKLCFTLLPYYIGEMQRRKKH